jgi:hypothetical protein
MSIQLVFNYRERMSKELAMPGGVGLTSMSRDMPFDGQLRSEEPVVPGPKWVKNKRHSRTSSVRL